MDTALLLNKDWRISHLYKIINKDKQLVTFTRNRAQRHFDQHKASRNIILKSRQLGFTTDEGLDSLDDTLFTPHFQSLFIAHTKDDATDIFDKKIDFAWKNIGDISPIWHVQSDTSNKLRFDFGELNGKFEGKTVSSISVANSGRSGTYNRVHISEFAKLCTTFPIRANEIITGTIPAVPIDGRIDIESTAEGMGGHFADMFWEAYNRGEPTLPTQFKAHFYNWTWDDDEINKVQRVMRTTEMEDGQLFAEIQSIHNLSDREITYYYLKWISLNKDWDILKQEYPTTAHEAFILSGTPYFDNTKIQLYIAKARTPRFIGEMVHSDFVPISGGKLKVWKKPEENHSYVIGGDVAEGIEGGDFSTLHVLDNETLEHVAQYRGTIPPDEFARVAFAVAVWFNNAYLGVEANKDGLWVNTELFKMGYSNLYWREVIDDITNAVSHRVGFVTGQRERPVILAELKAVLSKYASIWNSVEFLDECMTFARNKIGRPEAMSGRHDDLVIAAAIALEIRRNAPHTYAQPISTPLTAEERVILRLEHLKRKKNPKIISQSNYY